MSDQHLLVDEVSRRSPEGISDVQDRPEGSPQNNGSKLRQNNEKKPEKMETGKEYVNSDSIWVEPSSFPGIQRCEEVQTRCWFKDRYRGSYFSFLLIIMLNEGYL